MNKYAPLIMVMLSFGVIGMINANDPVKAGNFFLMSVNADNNNNNLDEDLDGLSVTVVIYDLGVILKTNPFDLDDGDVDGKILTWDVPGDTPPGDYWARITVSNDDIRQTKHRIITIN